MAMTQAVILISGKRFAGKDAFADALESALMSRNLSCYRCAFADEAKRRFCNFNSIDYEEFQYNRALKEHHRQHLIDYAESMKAEFGLSYWVDELLAVTPCLGYQFVLITDFRFYEEYETLRKTFPEERLFTIRLDATDEERRQRGWVHNPQIDEHKSETSLDHFIFTFTVHLHNLVDTGRMSIAIASDILTRLQILPYEMYLTDDE